MSNLTAYTDQFLTLRSAPDILAVTGKISKASKEISEAIAIREKLKPLVFKYPMKFSIVDLCSGNALVPLLGAFTLPVKHSIAVDKRVRKHGTYLQVQRFEYIFKDIYLPEIIDLINENSPVILTSVHCCKNLARRTIEIFQKSKAEHLIMMPCCEGRPKQIRPPGKRSQAEAYLFWVTELVEEANGRFSIDNQVISPKNCIIEATKANLSERKKV